ncbi:MAG: chemotaxis protein CheW [Fibrobacterota bacterium]
MENTEIDANDSIFESENTLDDRYLTFWIGAELYGIAIRDVIEIVGVQRITSVPDTPDFVKGVVNLRGQVIPVVDVRLRFHMQEREYDDETCFIVVRLNDTTIGMVVDTVDEVFTISGADILPAPRVSASESGKYMHGMSRVNDKTLVLVNTEKLLFDGMLASEQ